MELKAFEFEQNGIKLYITAMPVKYLVDENKVKVDIFVANTEKGYQRKPTLSRTKDYARYLKSGGISPTSILLNIRGEIGNFVPIQGNFGTLPIPDITDIWIVDGQHRIEGLKYLLEQDPKYATFPIPVVLMHVSSEYDEAMQFVIINKTHIGIKPDLAEQFIAKMSKRENAIRLMNLPRVITRDIEWRPKATDIIKILNTKTSEKPDDDFYKNPWFQNIQLPNELKLQTTASQKAFEDSIKQLLSNDSFRSYNAEETAIILVRYWKAILELCPQASLEPKNFVLQRTTGLAVMHKLLPRVASICVRNGTKLTIAGFKEVLHNMPDGNNDLFWSNNGMAGNVGTSQKSFGILISTLSNYLEEGNPEEEGDIRPFNL